MKASLPFLEEGVAHHRAGDLAAAERAYRAALAATPGDVDALHLLGLVAEETGHRRDALDLIRAAVAASPHRLFFESLGRILAALGEREEAARCFANALALYRRSDAAFDGLNAAWPGYGDDVEPLLHVPAEAGLALPVGGDDVLNLADREAAARILAASVNRFCERQGIARYPASPAGTALEAEGIAELGRVLTPTQVGEIVGRLDGVSVYNMHTQAHSDGVLRNIAGEARRYHFGAYDLATLLKLPHLLELANRPELVAMAEAYLGCVPTIYGLNLWWSFAGHPDLASSNNHLHRDRDDVGFCTLFLYLTDVDEESGPHVFIRGTHRRQALDRLFASGVPSDVEVAGERRSLETLTCRIERNDELFERVFRDQLVRLVGPAGTAALIDTNGLHRGDLPRRRDRLLFSARYGFGRASTYVQNRLAPLPRAGFEHRLPWSPKDRYVNRLFIG